MANSYGLVPGCWVISLWIWDSVSTRFARSQPHKEKNFYRPAVSSLALRLVDKKLSVSLSISPSTRFRYCNIHIVFETVLVFSTHIWIEWFNISVLSNYLIPLNILELIYFNCVCMYIGLNSLCLWVINTYSFKWFNILPSEKYYPLT